MIDAPAPPFELQPYQKAAMEQLQASEFVPMAIDLDMAYHRYKVSGGPHRDNDARAFQLQQQYPTRLTFRQIYRSPT